MTKIRRLTEKHKYLALYVKIGLLCSIVGSAAVAFKFMYDGRIDAAKICWVMSALLMIIFVVAKTVVHKEI